MDKPFFRLMSGRIERATKDSAAFDLFSAETEPIYVGDKPVLIKTGVRSEFTPGFVAIMKERSGLGLKGMELKAGVIDADYRGEWGVVCRFPIQYNHKFDEKTGIWNTQVDLNWKPFLVEPGAKLAQFLLLETAKLEMVNGGGHFNFFDDVRGSRGFGSSG